MIRVYCDFNDATEDGRYWILFHEDAPLADRVEALDLKDGDRVLLFSPNDLEVEATLRFGCTDPYFLGETICAQPDWSTRKDLFPPPPQGLI